MHLRRLKHDPRCLPARDLGCLPEERVEEVDSVVVSEPVDAHMSIDLIVVEAVLVRVDAGAEDQLREKKGEELKRGEGESW